MYSTRRSMDWPAQISSYYDGTPAAFDAIYDYWFPRFASHARLSGIPDADAQDVALETLFKIAHTRDSGHRFDPSRGVAFSTWIFTIARNAREDYWRRRKRCPIIAEDDDSTPAGTTVLDNVPDTQENPFHASARQRLGKDLQECLDRIDGALREVFVLRELEDSTLEDIAAAVGASITTAFRRVEAAKIGLRECLGNKGYGQEAIA